MPALPLGRRLGASLAAGAAFALLATGFLARSLSPDGLLTPPAAAGGRLLWPDASGPAPRFAGWPFGTANHVTFFAPYAAFIQR